MKDHPHACGDKYIEFENGIKRRGSSPRVWGQVVFLRYGKVKKGIIPTRVGTRFAV